MSLSARELKRRISQSMSDTGSRRATAKCKKMQRKLARKQKKSRNHRRKRW